MPKVRKGEKENEYVSRCVGDNKMEKEFPDQKQRLAVCYSKFERRNESVLNLSFKEFLMEVDSE